MSECGSKARTGSDIFDDTSFHESIRGTLPIDTPRASPSGTGPLEAASPSSMHGYLNEVVTLGSRTQIILVFDVRRSTDTFVPLQISRTNADAMDLKQTVAEKYKVSPDCVITRREGANNIAVIADQEWQKNKIFLLFNLPFFINFLGINATCVSVNEDMSVSEFMNVHSEKFETDDIEMLYLFLQGKIYKTSTQKFGDLGLSRLVDCKLIKQTPLKVRCHYHTTPDVEIVYHLNCFNTDSVGDMKSKFCQQFEKEFQSNLNERGDIWFCSSSRILNDVDYFLVEGEKSENEFGILVTRLEDITIQVSNKDSIPVMVSFTDFGKRLITKVLVTEPKPSIEVLRLKIAKHFNQEPNSLKLKLKQKKISDSILPGGFKPNDHIFAESSSKTTFKIEIFLDDRIISRRNVEMFKNDKVSQLKDLLASLENINDFLVELRYSDDEMDSEKRLKEYRIGSNDAIAMVICSNRIKLTIRCRRNPPHNIAIQDARTTTVVELKRYLSGIFKIESSGMNLILDGKSLNSLDTLKQAGIKTSDTLVASRLSECERKYQNGIFLVYCFDKDGKNRSVKRGLLHEGALLFVKGGEDRFQQRAQTEIVPKGIRLLNIKQNEQLSDVYPKQRINKEQNWQNMSPHIDSNTAVKTSAIPETTEQEMIREFLSTVEDTSTSSTLKLSSEAEIEQQDNAGTVRTTMVTKKSQTVTACSPMVNPSSIPSTAVAVHSMYEGKILRNTDGTIIKSESRVIHTTLTREKLAELDTPSSEDHSEFTSTLTNMTSSRHSFQKEPREVELDKILIFVSHLLGSDWEKLALHLGLEMTDIQRSRCRNQTNLDMQAYTMLCLWKQKTGKSATKEKLIQSLKQCERNDIAEKLEELHTDTKT